MLTIGAMVLVFPYLWMLLTSFKTQPESISLKLQLFPEKFVTTAYSELWEKVPFLSGVKNTLIIEFSVIIVGTFVSTMAAFSFAKLKLRNKTFWLLFLMSGMMVPYAALMLPQYRAFQALNMTDSLWPLILPGFFGNISMMFFLIQYMKGISNSYFEAAKIDGASEMRQFLVIMLPLVKTAISAQVIFWFIGIWNDFFAPEIYLDTKEKMTLQPLLQRINTDNAGGGNYPMIMAGAVLASIPMMVIYITCQKYFIESLAISGVKG
jgi:multiple sugar transport system permease protein